MARTKGPLFSLQASGQLGGAIVYSIWKGRPYVRILTIPSNPKSGLQVGMRSVFKYITQSFSGLTAALKTAWEAENASDNITALNSQVKACQKLARRNLGWIEGPAESAGTTPDAPTAPGTVAQPKTLVLSWTRPAVNKGDYSAAIYMSATTGFTADISNLIGIVDDTVVTLTVPNLVTGTEQFWVVRETNTDGELGAVSVEDSGTPT